MRDWLSLSPQILAAVGLLVAPGFVVALCLRLRWWDALGVSAPLSLGVLALANLASSHLHVAWGLRILAETTVAVGVVCLVLAWLGARFLPRREDSEPPSFDGASWVRRDHLIAAVVTLGVMLIGAYAVMRGIHTPYRLNQSYDAAFHMNSIHFMVQKHSAAPAIFGQMGNPDGGGFYPPTFGSIGALLVMSAHVGVVAASNLTALAIAIVWPLSLSIMIRRIARPSVFGYSVAMVGTFSVLLYPTLLLRWGVVWPDALSVLAIAPAVVMVAGLLGLGRMPDGVEDPHGRLAWFPCLLVLLITLPGMIYAQPGSAFMVGYLSVPLLVWLVWRRVIEPRADDVRRAMSAIGGLGVVVGLALAFIWLTYQVAAVASVGRFYWPTYETWEQAIGEVLVLDTRITAGNTAFAILVIIGIFAGIRHARGRFLIAGWAIIGALCVMSATVQSPLTRFFTGYWYNDSLRIYGALPVMALPLVALGADALRDRMSARVAGYIEAGKLRWRTRRLSVGVVAGLAICVGIVALQEGVMVDKAYHTITTVYVYQPGRLISPGEEAMFQRLGKELSPGKAIAGNPWTGTVLAGVLSGRPNIYPTFQPGDSLRTFVALHFNEYRQDPAVCAAVHKLGIGIVVTAPHDRGETPDRHAQFVGFDYLPSTPGLTVVDQGGGATAFRVGPCRS